MISQAFKLVHLSFFVGRNHYYKWKQQLNSCHCRSRMDLKKVREERVIYKIDSDQKSSNSYHKAMNDAAFKLCLDDPSLLKERGKLIDHKLLDMYYRSYRSALAHLSSSKRPYVFCQL